MKSKNLFILRKELTIFGQSLSELKGANIMDKLKDIFRTFFTLTKPLVHTVMYKTKCNIRTNQTICFSVLKNYFNIFSK